MCTLGKYARVLLSFGFKWPPVLFLLVPRGMVKSQVTQSMQPHDQP